MFGLLMSIVLNIGPVDLTQAKKATVIVFMSHDCPCSLSHEKELVKLYQTYSNQGFQFVGVFSNLPKDYNLPFPMVEDTNSKIADDYAALKTPHVFVVDQKGNNLYRGAVSNSTKLESASKFYLASALEQIAAGKNPSPKETRSLGCPIDRP